MEHNVFQAYFITSSAISSNMNIHQYIIANNLISQVCATLRKQNLSKFLEVESALRFEYLV